MQTHNTPRKLLKIMTAAIIALLGNLSAHAAENQQPLLLKAQRLFDGVKFSENAAVLIVDGKIKAVGSSNAAFAKTKGLKEINLGNATLLPGFIDLHSHILFQNVPQDKVLEHGITTARDLGGALKPISGGDGHLRLLTVGSILTVKNGYPLTVFGGHDDKHGHHHEHSEIAAIVESPEQARELVRHLIAGGANLIKISLEPGGEAGAGWSNHGSTVPLPWPMLSLEMVQAITDEAHKLGKKVAAHVAEIEGVKLALAGGVDEWAHAPCLEVSDELLQQAAQQKVKVIPTLDTLSHCPGIFQNVKKLTQFGVEFLYGVEIAHPDIPWGIDAQELKLLNHVAGLSPIEVLQTATAKAGSYLGLAPLGTISKDAPADIIAVKGNPLEKFKLLEYPDLVMSGGKLVVNNFEK
jgi:imidazolonepropionase-like amidohydrolase